MQAKRFFEKINSKRQPQKRLDCESQQASISDHVPSEPLTDVMAMSNVGSGCVCVD